MKNFSEIFHNIVVAFGVIIAAFFTFFEIIAYLKQDKAQLEVSLLLKQLNGVSSVSANLGLREVHSTQGKAFIEVELCIGNSGSAPEILDISNKDSLSIAKIDIEGRTNQVENITSHFDYSRLEILGHLHPSHKLFVIEIYLPSGVEKCFNALHTIENQGLYVVQFQAKSNIDIQNEIKRIRDKYKVDSSTNYPKEINDYLSISNRKYFQVTKINGVLKIQK